MENKYFKCLYENNWYKIKKIDFESQIVTFENCANIHIFYIDEIKEVK